MSPRLPADLRFWHLRPLTASAPICSALRIKARPKRALAQPGAYDDEEHQPGEAQLGIHPDLTRAGGLPRPIGGFSDRGGFQSAGTVAEV